MILHPWKNLKTSKSHSLRQALHEKMERGTMMYDKKCQHDVGWRHENATGLHDACIFCYLSIQDTTTTTTWMMVDSVVVYLVL